MAGNADWIRIGGGGKDLCKTQWKIEARSSIFFRQILLSPSLGKLLLERDSETFQGTIMMRFGVDWSNPVNVKGCRQRQSASWLAMAFLLGCSIPSSESVRGAESSVSSIEAHDGGLRWLKAQEGHGAWTSPRLRGGGLFGLAKSSTNRDEQAAAAEIAATEAALDEVRPYSRYLLPDMHAAH